MKRALITGAMGFIGKSLIQKMSELNVDIITVDIIDGDVTDQSTWEKLPDADVVIHLAGKTFVPDSWSSPSSFIDTNLMGTVCALEYCKKRKSKLIILSSYLYGNPDILPIPESSKIVTPNPYAFSKKLAEDACRFYSEMFGIQVTILRPFNVYGPGQDDKFLIQSIIHQVLNSSFINVKDLEPKRDYVYIDDLVDAIIKGISYNKLFGIFNIGSGISYSVNDIIVSIQEITKTNLEVKSEGIRRPNEIMNTIADISLAKSELNWKPQYSLHDGLSLIIKSIDV